MKPTPTPSHGTPIRKSETPLQPDTEPTFKEPRKMTLEILVDQTNDDWHWVYESMMELELRFGMKICGIADEWKTEVDEENE